MPAPYVRFGEEKKEGKPRLARVGDVRKDDYGSLIQTNDIPGLMIPIACDAQSLIIYGIRILCKLSLAERVIALVIVSAYIISGPYQVNASVQDSLIYQSSLVSWQ